MKETSDVSRSVNRYYVYILQSYTDNGLYIGYTENLKTRLTQHKSGKVRSTHLRVPFQLIHYEYFINQKDAKAREIFLKSGFGRSQLKEFLKNTFYARPVASQKVGSNIPECNRRTKKRRVIRGCHV